MKRAGLGGLAVAVGVAELTVVGGPARAADACTTTFTGAVDHAWEKAGNWDHGVPTSASVACLAGAVTVSTGAQEAGQLRGDAFPESVLTVSGGSLTLDGASQVPTWLQTGGTLTANDTFNSGIAHWTGASTVNLLGATAFFHDLTIDGTGTTLLTGNEVDTASMSISNPGFTINGPLGLEATALRVGSGVVVAHTGGGGVTISTQGLAGPISGLWGFRSTDLTAIPSFSNGSYTIAVASASTLVAASIALPNGSVHGAISHVTLTGSGTVDARTISGHLSPPDGSDLHLLGPVDLSQAEIDLPLTTSCTTSGQVVVTGGAATLGGTADAPLAFEGCVPAPGTTFPLLTDAAGLVNAAATTSPVHQFHVSSTATTASLVANQPTRPIPTFTTGPVIRPGQVLHLSVPVTSPVGTPTGTVTVSKGCGTGPVPEEAATGTLPDTADLQLSLPSCSGESDPAPGFYVLAVAYSGDDTHAPSTGQALAYVSYPPVSPRLGVVPASHSATVTYGPGADQPAFDPITSYTVTVTGPCINLTRTTPGAGLLPVTGLQLDATYLVTAVAADSAGPGSRTTSTFTTTDVPGAPTITTSSGSGSITATVGAAPTHGVPVQRYVVTSTPLDPWLGPVVIALDAKVGAPTVLSHLVAGEAYSLVVTPWSSLGAGTPSAPIVRVAAKGAAISLLRGQRSLVGYASRDGVPVAGSAVTVARVLGPGPKTLKHLRTDADGRFAMSYSPRTTTQVHAISTLTHRGPSSSVVTAKGTVRRR